MCTFHADIGILTVDGGYATTVYYENGATLNLIDSSGFTFSECNISWSNDCSPTAVPTAVPASPTLIPTPLPTYGNNVPYCQGRA